MKSKKSEKECNPNSKILSKTKPAQSCNQDSENLSSTMHTVNEKEKKQFITKTVKNNSPSQEASKTQKQKTAKLCPQPGIMPVQAHTQKNQH